MPLCLACANPEADRWAVASDEEYYTTSEQFTYYRCRRCESLFIDPVPRDCLQQIYPANYYSFDEQVTQSFLFRVKDWLDQRFFRKFIARLPQSQINLLDVGGGTGALLTSLRKIDARIRKTTVVDLDEHAGVLARQNGHEYFCGRIEHYQPEQPFSVILMLNVLEHVDNPKELLVKARNLLAPQGILIIKTPNTDSLDAWLFRDKNWGGYHCPRHWVLFKRENLAAMVEETGLKIQYFTYTQGAPFWTTSVLFALRRHKWIDTSAKRPIPKHPLYAPLNLFFAGVDLVRGPFAKTSQMFIVLENS
ncbi:MAG: class I SAM-dependent methyltransferase [Deltaproteobacteria bacterium]|nr:class I SAM-dependent methyltransferase [Deltaproteobacteria bacterium]